MEENRTWYLFSYKVPAEPSTLRVRIWRNLKALGVLYIQQSVCLVPKTPDIENKLARLRTLIGEHHGESFMVEIVQFSHYSQQELIQLFNAQRAMEYEELLESCSRFLQSIKDEIQTGQDQFGDIEENEMELMRLKRWYRKIMKRDYFKHELSLHSKECLKRCEEKLYSFSEAVYELEGAYHGE
ncbi:hypothetical protein LCY76_04190 [Fictibacillus sp. KIGAM418]|uniref:ChrB N-terminal domain-containing protein n=1 Tax=Fictibacillus marinisediminis TaxID=2878389 RepID=A0A9X1X800_9BACL|nr:Chromate resistance protein ChrB [Fictibacillus marinisediminis]MCK6255802.1 hypothetical protein [Fictibacillus marinisediminis]